MNPADSGPWQALDREFRQAVALPGVSADDPRWWDRWHVHIASRLAPQWFYDADTAPGWFREHWPALTDCWVRKAESLLADLVYAGDFRPERKLSGDIDWGANPTCSMNWAGFHYWSWANPLIRGYGLTGDERFPREFANHLRSYFEQVDTFEPQLWEGPDPAERDWRDWITFNALSAGIKMATFAEAVMVFARAAAWTPEDLQRATLLLVRLARRVNADNRNMPLKELKQTRNFLTSGASGLGVTAIVFPECPWSEEWLTLAEHILETHVRHLYYGDGGHKELCTQYHKAGLRDILFFEQALIAARGHAHCLEVEPYRTRMRRMLKWLADIMMPDGTTTVLNSSAAANDWLVLFVVANKRLHDKRLEWHIQRWIDARYVPRQKGVPALCARVLGGDDRFGTDWATRAPRSYSVRLHQSGLAVLRDGWERDSSVMVLDFGRPVGGHAYPARSSFSLYLNGKPAAMSPGSPHAYTDPDYRRWMHTSRSQNMVLIDDVDQEQWAVFGRKRVHGEILEWKRRGISAFVRGRHNGYRLNLGIDHVRSVYFRYGAFFLVHDVLIARDAREDHVAKWSLHCPEPWKQEKDRDAVIGGLIRVTPAWPAQVSTLEFGSEGKAVWPGASEDGTTDTLRRLHQARWHKPLAAGTTQQFLMLIQPDTPEPATFSRLELRDDALYVQVATSGGYASIEFRIREDR